MTAANQANVSVVIPVYGSASVLPVLVSRLDSALTVTGHEDYEIIFVCDNSPDSSWSVIQSLASANGRIKGILLRINAGQHNALMAGFSVAKGAIIVTMDDDLQHAPEDVPNLISALAGGEDVVYARFSKRKHARWKIIGSKINDIVAGYLLGKPRGLYLSPFRAITRSICLDILRYRGPFVYVDGLILMVTRNITAVDVSHHERYAGESGYSLRKSLSLWLKMATGFSIVPLRLTSLVGLALAGTGFALAIALVIQKFTTDAMPDGWSSLMVSALVIGGVQCVALGVIGEYIGRLLLTVNVKPQYSIAEVTQTLDRETR